MIIPFNLQICKYLLNVIIEIQNREEKLKQSTTVILLSIDVHSYLLVFQNLYLFKMFEICFQKYILKGLPKKRLLEKFKCFDKMCDWKLLNHILNIDFGFYFNS